MARLGAVNLSQYSAHLDEQGKFDRLIIQGVTSCSIFRILFDLHQLDSALARNGESSR